VLDGRVIRAVEHLDNHRLARKRLESQRPHELGRMARHHDANLNAAPLQPPQNFGGLICADAACYTQKYSHKTRVGERESGRAREKGVSSSLTPSLPRSPAPSLFTSRSFRLSRN